jgi:hypothetical protein
MTLEALPVGAIPVESTAGKSPVEVIASIRKDLAEFQRTSSKEALREFMREACKEDLIQAFHHNADAPSAVIEHLVDRGLIPLPSSRWAKPPASKRDRR